jgi:cytochrome c oxidase cbb3-type subunit 3/ubiquinol-cytochrome c reductase cytochrome c subunit
MDFRTLFDSNCAGCHGSDGKSGAARVLNDSLYLAYIGRDHFREVVQNGRPGTAMPAWAKAQGGPLTDRQIDALVNGVYSHWENGPAPQNLPPYDNSSGDINAGRRAFLMNCFMCHGKGARVGSVTDPQYASLVSDQYIRDSIVAGRKDLGMPDYRTLALGKPLTEGNINDLVAFISSYRPAGAAAGRTNDAGTGNGGATTKGNEGSGNGPGNPRPQQKNEGNKGQGSSSQQGVK